MKKVAFWGTLALLAAWAQAQPYATWSRFRTISLNTSSTAGGAGVPSAINNFPLMVRLTSVGASTGANVLSEALANGADVRFTDSTGLNALPFQIDSWGASSAVIWVKVPVVAGNATTNVRIYWGKAGQTTLSSGATTFDTANGFTGAWHLNENGGGTANVLDASGNALNFNGHASVTSVPGMIGNARFYNNSEDAASFFVDDFTGTGNATKATKFQAAGLATRLTISAWVNPQANSGQDIQGIFGHYRYNATARSYMLSMGATGEVRINVSTTGSNDQVISTTSTPLATLSAWRHVMFTIDTTAAANSQLKVYVDGVRQPMGNRTTSTIFTAPVASDAARPLIGAMETSYNHRFRGYIDELEFSNGVTRDSNWAKLSYETQKAAVTAVTMGVTQAVGRALYYPLKTANYLLNAPIETNTPVLSGALTGSFSIAPAASNLPAGLAFSTTTGAISGTPTALKASTQFIVGATVGGVASADTITVAVSAGDPPGAPSNVTATRGNRQVTLAWSAPLIIGSAPISGYKAMAAADTAKSCTTTGALTCNVTGLTNGTAYTFIVRASSAAGAGAASNASLSVTPAGVPGAPTNLVATTAISLSWTAPASDSGSPIIEYYGTSTPVGASCYVGLPAPLTCSVGNVTPATSYTFTVYAVNGVGQGAPSAPSNAVTGLNPGSFVIRVSGSAKPFTFVLPDEALVSADKVTMSISDIYGRTVWSKSVNPKADKVKEVTWNGKASNGLSVSAGMYVVKVSTVSGGKTSEFTRKAISIKSL